MEGDITISSLNVNGLGIQSKRIAIFTWLKNKYNGIHFLQETHSTIDSVKVWEREWDGQIIFSHGESNSKGVAILLDKFLDIHIVDTKLDTDGRYILLHCTINDKPLILLNVYCPTKDKQQEQLHFVNKLTDLLSNYDEHEIIIGGDLNTYLDIKVDKQGKNREEKSKCSIEWNNLLENYNLEDIWRIRNRNKKRFTWRSNTRGGLVQSRIDYFLVSKSLGYNITKTEIDPSIKSDHSIISIGIKFLEYQQRGRGLWKMNCKFLKDKVFLETMRKCIISAKLDSVNIKNEQYKWEYIKCRIRSECIDYSILNSKLEKEKEIKLLHKLETLEEELDRNPNCDKHDEYKLIKSELEFIYSNRARGSIVRSRCKWVEENERNTKFFLNLEKRNYNTKHIKTLIMENKTINKPEEILNCELNFYKNLYSEQSEITEIEIDNYLNNIESPKIRDTTKNNCDAKLSIEECSKAAKDLPNNKAPGPDGIPVDFYKMFWPILKDEMFENFLICKKEKILLYSQREGIINLIPKEGKDLRELKNWRPLSLLNADYKILTKILANRLKTGLKEIINEDQIGYMENRFCGENTRLIADVIEYAKYMKVESILLLIDFEKAFDTINWNFLFKTLKFYNFGDNFIDWIRIIYKDIFSRVTNNGYLTETFLISRGIRQGDPISALLFLPVAEIMATVIRNRVGIRGINIDGIEIKLCQLADDTSLFLGDLPSLRAALKCFEEFYRYAGLKLNRTKTEAIILFNSGNIIPDLSLNIKWHSEPFKTLGIWYSLDRDQMLLLNINERKEKIKNIFRVWNMRFLSLKGKITILKSLIMPHIIHLASVIYLTEDVIKEFDNMFFNFFWSYKKHGINKDTLIQNIDSGGIKMICISTMIKSIKLMWFKRLLNNINAKWKKLSWFFLGIDKKILFSRQQMSKTQQLYIPFYDQNMRIWYNFLNIDPISRPDVLNENLFNNLHIMIDQKTLGSEFNFLNHANINKIEHVIDSTRNQILNHAQLCIRCNCNINILTYNKFLTAIPSGWKQLLKNDDKHGISKLHKTLFKDMDISKLYNKDAYNYLLDSKIAIPKSQNKWIEYYPFLETANWIQIYRLPYYICRDTYMQSLQYKILHRYISCNENLYKWKIKESPNCMNCGLIDSIEHFFFDCEKSKLFWNNIRICITNTTYIDIKFTILEVLLGILQENEHSKMCNYVILHGKGYIHHCRCKDKDISAIEFLRKLKYKLTIDREIAITQEKLDEFERVFGELYDSL